MCIRDSTWATPRQGRDEAGTIVLQEILAEDGSPQLRTCPVFFFQKLLQRASAVSLTNRVVSAAPLQQKKNEAAGPKESKSCGNTENFLITTTK